MMTTMVTTTTTTTRRRRRRRMMMMMMMNLLGITPLPSLKWDQHIEIIISKANRPSRRYFLVVLKRAGVHADQLQR